MYFITCTSHHTHTHTLRAHTHIHTHTHTHAHAHTRTHTHTHTQKHSHQPQPTTQHSSQPSLRTILPKPHPSDAHDIIVTENSLITSNKVLVTPAAISSSSDTPQTLASIRTLQNATTGLSQPIVISASQAGHMITTSSPIIPTATQSGVQIIDLTRNLAQKYSTSTNTGQKTVLTATTVPLSATTSNQKGAMTASSLIQMTHSSTAQPKKAPVPPVSTGAQTTRIETPRTKSKGSYVLHFVICTFIFWPYPAF